MVFYVFFGYLSFTLLVILAFSLKNLIDYPVLKSNNEPLKENPFISFLIPVRNEEQNIPELLNSLLKLSYQNYEIIVLDDGSEDNSQKILESYEKKHSKINYIRGKNKPKGWIGKNWACHQLSSYAKGNLFIFIDADVFLEAHTIEAVLKIKEKYQLQLLSIFPHPIYSGILSLTIPLLNWILLSFLPLKWVYKSKKKAFSAANGQFMLFEKEAYFNTGGHKTVAHLNVEDIALMRVAKKKKLRVMSILSGSFIQAKMYSSLSSSIKGIARSLYRGMGLPATVYIFFILFFTTPFIAPFIGVFFNPFYLYLIFLIFINRFIVSFLVKQNIIMNLALHFFQMFFFLWISFYSLIINHNGMLTWKGRKL